MGGDSAAACRTSREGCRGSMTGGCGTASSGGCGRERRGLTFQPAMDLTTTCVNRFNRWRRAGDWDRLLAGVSEAYEGDIQMIDSSSIRVHQHGANAQKKDARSRCMGRSRGGLTTKIHAVVDANGLPVTLKLTEGQAHDCPVAREMLDTLGPGQTLLGDRAYDSDELRSRLAQRGAWANIRPNAKRKQAPPSVHSSTRNATGSNASSTASNTSALSPQDTTSWQKITSPTSSSPQPASGCAIMNR